ncbi:M20 family metallopeptidase [Crossiella sp. SN42]|uniref:M20 metallopeptidase family protein n=1 Tax=Crossiella sp. SN42 TaxID=2944808 RepID=UPI00207C6F66|nr:M20 family metallopeptidase [Crossiella sp. SN42]MCO1574602.1 M20 family metallopeptidase [Crossiella sp. SN42]
MPAPAPLTPDGDLLPGLRRLRAQLHAEPEAGLHLPRTQRAVLDALAGLDLEVGTGTGLSSVTAVRRGQGPGPTVLLRADMDALPGPDGVPAHTCGHDLHTAMLVGAARLLHRESFHGNVILMFQPGEEHHGGARIMIEEGVLAAAGEPPVAAYALHVLSALLPRGIFVSRPGPILGSADTLRVTVRGRAGHSAMPHLARNPIPVACALVAALEALPGNTMDAFDPVVVTPTAFAAGHAGNVIPEQARFTVSVRAFSAAARTGLIERITRLLHGIAAAHGATVEVEEALGYPATVNHPAEEAFAAGVVGTLFGAGRYLRAPRPLPAAEDFSYVLQRVPGAYLVLGACPADRDPASAAHNHAPEAVFDDTVLADGARLLAALALHRLRRDPAESEDQP